MFAVTVITYQKYIYKTHFYINMQHLRFFLKCSGKEAPEENIDGEENESVDVADVAPERFLLNVGELPLQGLLFLLTESRLRLARQTAQPHGPPLPK